MNEIAKTIVFVIVAAAALGGSLLAVHFGQSQLSVLQPEDMLGKPLFDDFDPLKVTSLQIDKYNEATGSVTHFKVAQVNGIWSVPSHSDYPADAEDQLAEAASSVMGLEVIGVESKNPGDHGLYGVIDPDPKTLKPGTLGVGTRVVMKGKLEDKDNQSLVALIIGKEVEKRDGLRYVRHVGQDPVYTVAVDPDKLSTKFDDWIEDDLLKLNTWDIKQVQIHDYSVDELQRTVQQRSDITLGYDDMGDPKWTMIDDEAFSDGKWVSMKMAENEELDTATLDLMKDALDDLKIVDVRRKPAGLSSDLKTNEGFGQDDLTVTSLMTKGFFVASLGGRVQLVSNEGDVTCTMKDGVEYVLRFGAIAETPSAEKDGATSQGSAGLNRYIFVMAQFNPNAIPKPELEPLPEKKTAPAEEKPAEEEPVEETPAEEEPAEEKPAEEKPAEEEPAEEKPAVEGPAEDEPATDEAGNSASEGTTETAAEVTTDESAEDDEPAMDDVQLAAEQERVETENRRKMDEYEEKVAKGKEQVEKLNARFADWYYIIPDEVYQKIHLGRDQIVREKKPAEDPNHATPGNGQEHGETPDAKGTLDAFNRLREQLPEGE